ncbi:ATP-binding protein [Flavobacterium potami]|uniref:ATP-binding protein n=1 Tax=Flavobacterium potami TaxID=2872310 RepID=UPI001CBB66D0
MFEPFVTTKASRQGMGLGLSIVHTVITRMGGRVIAGNNPDKGASFTIQLPLI